MNPAAEEPAGPTTPLDGEGTSVVNDDSFKALYAETRERRLSIRHLLMAGEHIEWDAAMVCPRAPQGASPIPNEGHLFVTDRRFVYTQQGDAPVILKFADIEPVSIVKTRHRTKALSIVTRSGMEWLYEEAGSLNLRAMKHYANKRQ